jgi:NAD(P)-dependent dehydrogenase (short-subunit alcohol dehydrogenase family)
MVNRLQGKVAVVTGGGRGIGRGICRRFAREGASVVVAERDEADGVQVAGDLEGLGGKGHFVRTDVTQKAQVQRMIHAAVETFGRVDIVVNNAISLSPHVAFERKTEEMLDFALHVGVYATFWAMQEAFPLMRDQGGGRFINFYSNDANIGQWMQADYNVTKAGIRALTISGAAEWGRYNILCNAIAPAAAGTIYYELLKKVPQMAEMVKQHPLGRAGDPETDIAPVALFLATEDSQYMNGQTLYVDGGMSLGRAGVYPADDA